MRRSPFRIARDLFAFSCLALILVWATGRLAMAQGFDHVSQVMTVEPLAGWRAEERRHVAGLRFALAPGWKTYWRSAGSAGIAPRMDWSASDGIRAVAPAWPTPRPFRQGADLSIGYETGFVLPLLVETAPGPAVLRGRLDLGVCSAICLPVRMEVAIDLPEGGTPDPRLRAALADRPRRVAIRADCATRPTLDGLALTGAADLPPLGGPEVVVFEVPDRRLWVTDAAVSRAGDRITATSEVMVAGGQAVSLDRAAVRITVIGADGAVELAGCAG